MRNYLTNLVEQGTWNKEAPGPELPERIVTNTLSKYLDAYKRLVGEDLKLD